MFLTATNEKLQAVLAGAPSAEWPIVVSYADLTSTTFVGGQQVTNTNSTTAVDILASPTASTVRQVKSINAYNAGNAVGTLTIMLDVAGTDSTLWSGLVPVGMTLSWSQEHGWTLGDSGGVSSVFGRVGAVVAVSGDYTASQVTNTPAGNIAATDVQAAVNELDSEKVAKAGDTMTGPLTLNTSAADFNSLRMIVVDDGVAGPFHDFTHDSASPDVGDFLGGWRVSGRTSTGVMRTAGQFYCQVVDPVNATYAARWRFFTFSAGASVLRLDIGAGLTIGAATSGDQGAGTLNATALYANANLVADTNGLLRTRSYTVGTLPAASGVAGAIARVSDASAAPVYDAVAAGGGSTVAKVFSNGTNWVYA